MPKTPSYRKRSGYDQAIVTLTDSVTKRRRDYWLGEYNTPESRERCGAAPHFGNPHAIHGRFTPIGRGRPV